MSFRHPARSRRVAVSLLAALALLVPAPAPAAPAAPQSSALTAPGWLAGTDGGVFTLGSVPFRGSLGGTRLNQPVIAVAGTPGGAGYWLAALDGGVFTFGDARFHGSLGSTHLNQPVTGMVATPSGAGYWLVAADGGVFTFGDARFLGSLGGARVTPAIATLAATPNGRGYWLLRRDGRVYHFGNAAALPDAAGAAALAVGLVPTRSGAGYWIAFADGTVRAFGDAVPVGLPPMRLAAPVVGIATPWASSSGFALALLDLLRGLAEHGPRRTWVGPHEVALTFDDGPSDYSLSMLAVLARYDVHATFFTVGYTSAERPDVLVAEAKAGMSVQIHNFDHRDLTRLSIPEIDDDLLRAADAVQAAIGRRPTCFRPPYGSTNPTVAAEGAKLGFTQILWNVDPSDYRRPGASVIASRVLAEATGRGLVVAIHDGGGDRSQTVAALPTIIEGLRARGYTFVTLCA